MKPSALTRRQFVAAAPAMVAAAQRNPSERVRIGVIGTGGHGQYLMGEVEKCRDLDVAVTAVCDVWRPNREKAAAMARETWGAPPRQTVDYEEMLGWGDVDAVLISAPDFLHSRMLEAAVAAGKDVYCEKPPSLLSASRG